MEETKPKSIKTVGISIIAISIFAIFSNGSFSLLINYVGGVEKLVGPNSATQFPGFYTYWSNLLNLSLLILFFSFLLIIGGILLIKFNRWARILLTSISVIFSLVLIVITANLVLINIHESLNPFEIVVVVISALFMIALLLVLVIYLNKKQIKKYFV